MTSSRRRQIRVSGQPAQPELIHHTDNLQLLSQEWQHWIQENQALNVPDAVLVETMVREGIRQVVATMAVRSMRARAKAGRMVQIAQPAKPKMPERSPEQLAQLLAKLESILAINQQVASLHPHHGQIERRDRVSAQEFLEQYYSASKPVILTNMMQDWAAMTSWCPAYFKQKYGSVEVEIQTGRAADPNYEINANRHKQKTTLGEYVDLIVNGGESNDYYLAANNGNLERPELKSLLNDVVMPEFLNPQETSQRIFFWFGPAGTVTPLHHDPLNLIMAHVTGRKRWRLISPNYTPLLYNYIGVFSNVDLECPDYEKYPLFRQVQVIETILEPGEIIFIPVGWWHQVKALEISLSLSFTNFIYPNSYTYQNPSIRDLPPAAETIPQTAVQPTTIAQPPVELSRSAKTKTSVDRSALVYDAVKANQTDGYLVDEIFPDQLLMISFGFVNWEGTPGFDFYGRSKKLEKLADRPINRILLRDFENAWYHRGVRGLGNGIDEVRDRLQALIHEICPSRIITIGQSMGGYAAILFGQLLNVDQILAFGPLSCLDIQICLEFGDRRWLSVMEDLQAHPPINAYFDLATHPLNPRQSPKLDIFYGQKPDPDTPGDINLDHAHAQRLATISNCTLHPYAESGHAIVQYLIEQRQLDPLLFEALFNS
jgi:ribosomal protein L16 Arg81 hydroxylase